MGDEKRNVRNESERLLADSSPRPSAPPHTGSAPQKLSWKWSLLIVLAFFTSFAYFIYIVTSAVNTPESTSSRPHPIKDKNHIKKAIKILEENPLIDGHNDLAILVRFLYKNQIYDSSFAKAWDKGGLSGHVDVPRIKTGRYGGAFWSAFMPCQSDVFDFSDEAYYPIVRATLEQLDLLQRLHAEYPKYFTPPKTASEALANFENGTFIAPYIIEGLHQIGNSLSTLRLYHSLGVRYATLSWNCHNRYVDAALITANGLTKPSVPLHHGVSKEGQVLIQEMNRMGMIVDLSHVSVDTMVDVLQGKGKWKGSVAPPIFSHSSAYAICPHPRNVPDHVLKLVKKRNSLVMVNFSPDFVSCSPPEREGELPVFDEKNNTLIHVARHIMHIGDLIGYDHVGIGTDYDGIETTPKGLEDVAKLPLLFAALLKAGVSEEDCIKLAGRNLLRVWQEVDDVAVRLQKEGVKPAEDDIKLPQSVDPQDLNVLGSLYESE